ncbi:DUF3971 domain-containing protein [Hoeflea ulvae]|uniref:DUF3971 domain-containing protein n=1 Tax=Hoeflea ulvae TaxID=2983764 RepID=A0ABT3YHQ2_9HYPH|nr:DUF3971 domain-containing protein [Hoeflea ulvae]MCY0095352.1 DUF3971 domain-containing protein [Hoeflea ulvae]
MPDQPIDKVQFKKRDIVSLHELPSANVDGSILVRGHHPRKWRHSAMRWTLGTVLVLALMIGGLLAALEAGVVDGFIRDRARMALAQAVGPDNHAELTSAALRLTAGGKLALVAGDVVLQRGDDPSDVNSIERVMIALEPWALLRGRISVASVDITGVGLASTEGDGFNLTDLAAFRVDETGAIIEQMFSVLNRIATQVDAVDAGSFRFSDISVTGAGGDVAIETAEVRRIDGRNYQFEADIAGKKQSFTISGKASAVPDQAGLSRITGKIEGLVIDFLTEGATNRQNGVATPLGVTFTAARALPGKQPALSVKTTALGGTLTMGGIQASLQEARVNLVYMPLANKIEITPSIIRAADAVLPFTGGLIDADRTDKVEGAGIAFDFVITNGLADPGDSGEAAIPFAGKALGWFDAANRRLVAEQLAVSTTQGNLLGSASWRFVEGISPEINMVAEVPQMTTAAVKQFWPYWMGKRARQWVLNNLYGGTVSNGRIQLATPAGHYKPFEDVRFDEDQLQIDFDIARARMNVAGDIPPLRDTVGHMRLRGSEISFKIDSATAFFPTGRTVEVADAVFSIPATHERPLMAELSMSVRGEADAVAELITYHPINVLDQIGLKPEELSGSISSTVTARFGLIPDQSPPPPDWTADLDMGGVNIAKPIEGRMLTDMNGRLYVTPQQAELKAEALVDGARMALDVVQPVGDSGIEARRTLSGTLSPEARELLAPGTDALITGPVGFNMASQPDGSQTVSLDLKPARLVVPGLGWTKGKGVAATLEFSMHTDGEVTGLSNLTLSGEGFRATGQVSLTQGQLTTATFDHVALSPRDDYHVAITRKGKGYMIELGGKSIDVRPLIALAKSVEGGETVDDSKTAQVELSGSVDAVHGYSDETLSTASFVYKGQGARIDLLDFKAVTKSGQALVMAVMRDAGGESVEVTSGDAGAFARFAGIYARIRGGLLNVRLKREGGPLRRGVVDIRNFEVVGEPRLNSLVSTPSKQDGKSLSDAVNSDIDLSVAEFEVANARVVSGNGELRISEGIVRGPQIGASFQGLVHNAKGDIDLTGTFMPAYGVNRLFGELPLIGLLLGNGRDRGLIGITFRLAGKTDSPLLQVNPLSVIAPGVFRSIFEYRP